MAPVAEVVRASDPDEAVKRAEAEGYIMGELDRLADRLEALEADRVTLYARRRELYNLGRTLDPPIPGARMAKAARVSDAALVLSSGRRRQPRKKAGEG